MSTDVPDGKFVFVVDLANGVGRYSIIGSAWEIDESNNLWIKDVGTDSVTATATFRNGHWACVRRNLAITD